LPRLKDYFLLLLVSGLHLGVGWDGHVHCVALAGAVEWSLLIFVWLFAWHLVCQTPPCRILIGGCHCNGRPPPPPPPPTGSARQVYVHHLHPQISWLSDGTVLCCMMHIWAHSRVCTYRVRTDEWLLHVLREVDLRVEREAGCLLYNTPPRDPESN
jgi:hypothetical protein